MDWDAKTYDRVSDPQFQWGLEVLSRMDLEGHETAMDAGCGTGRLTSKLCERLRNGQVIAVDQSATMLEQAQAALSPLHGGRIRFVQADLAELPLSGEVDVVFSTATFHWVKDHHRLFAALHRSLKPGGKLVAQCGGGPNLEKAHQHARALMQSPPFVEFYQGWEDPWFFAHPEETTDRLLRCGFQQVKVWLSAAPTSFTGPEALGEYMKTVILRNHLARLPSDPLKTTFLSGVVQALENDDPPRVLDYWRLNIQAMRPAA